MLDCWREDHLQRPSFAVIEQRIGDLIVVTQTQPEAHTYPVLEQRIQPDSTS